MKRGFDFSLCLCGILAMNLEIFVKEIVVTKEVFTFAVDSSGYVLLVKLVCCKTKCCQRYNNACSDENDLKSIILRGFGLFADEKHNEENYGIVERIIKSILWITGGYKIHI